MVYYAPHRRSYAAAAAIPANLSNIPEELALNIMKNTDNETLSALRATNTAFLGPSNTTLAERNKIVYLHPSLGSLRQGLKICTNSFTRPHIQEIVLLGKVSWRDLEAVLPFIRQPGCVDNITAASVKGRFCSWPRRPFMEGMAMNLEQATESAEFAFAYGKLMRAFASMPKLRALSFREDATEIGWNQTSQQLIDSHAHKCAIPPQRKGDHYNHADVDVVFNTLAALGGRITSLRLDAELPFGGPTVQTLRDLCSGKAKEALLQSSIRLSHIRNLENLELVIHIGTGNKEHALEGGLIAHAAPSLKHLKLTLVPQHARAQDPTDYDDLLILSVRSILEYGEESMVGPGKDRGFKRLESLTLEYRDPPVPAKCKDSRRRVRPSIQMLDLGTLLQRVRHRLTHVTIKNIIFTPEELTDLGTPNDVNVQIHEAIVAEEGSAFPNLEHFEWRINRFKHDPRCRSEFEVDTHRDCEKFSCGFYLPDCTLEMYEETAQRLGIELDTGEEEAGSGFGCWDFGAAIMRGLGREPALPLSSERELQSRVEDGTSAHDDVDGDDEGWETVMPKGLKTMMATLG